MTAENKHDVSNDGVNGVVGGSAKVENDPWVPLERFPPPNQTQSASTSANTATLQPAPQNPLYQIIDSEKYIQTLEQKLARLSKNRRNEPTPKDILTSLAVFHEDQMRRYLDDDHSSPPSTSDEGLAQASYLHRRLHPDRQPLTADEIAELVREDVLAQRFAELDVDDDNAGVKELKPQPTASSKCSEGPSTISPVAGSSEVHEPQCRTDTLDQQSLQGGSSSDDNWANFDEMKGGNSRQDS